MEHQISVLEGQYQVTVVDIDDNEVAEVYNIEWDGEKLSYNLYWNSSGRFVKNRLALVEEDKVDLTYTYTDRNILCRKEKEEDYGIS